MEEKLDLSISIWKDFYARAECPLTQTKLWREANDLCQCFKIPESIREQGRRIAREAGDKNVNNSKK